MNLWPLLVGLLCLVVTGRALIIASASVDGQSLRRDEQPVLYWAIILAAGLMSCFLFAVALTR